MEIPLLREVVIIFALSIVVILACHRIKLPSIVGFLITGILAGPHGFGLVAGINDVETLATVGIIFLLFTVGMEFSFKKILEYKRFFLVGGLLQVFITVFAGFIVGKVFGRPSGESLFLGFLLSLSSTAIVLRVLDDKSESDSPHGRLIIGVMIFQDIIAIPMMLLTPLLGEVGEGSRFDSGFAIAFGKGVVILAAVLIGAYKIIPKLMYYIARTRSRELFLLSILTVCFSVAWLTSSVGLSLSLGAFLAGLIVSESEYRNEAVGDILPFQDIFTSFFFVSIGMLLDLNFVFHQPLTILFLAGGILLLKALIASVTTLIVGMPLRTAFLAGVALSQIGEFSFVLAKTGAGFGLADDYRYQLFLSVALLTMAVTPTLIAWSPQLAAMMLRLPLPTSLKSGMKPHEQKSKASRKDHVIIIGFGLCGRSLARTAKEASLHYIILEMNPDTVRTEKQKGEPIHFGDATHATVLHHANIEDARVAAVLINDFSASMRIVELIKRLNPRIHLIVRTRYVQQMKPMYQLGADEVIPDEFGSSVEIFTRVMNIYQIPFEQIDKVVNDIRSESYEQLQLLYKSPSILYNLTAGLNNMGAETLVVHENSPLIGKTLAESELHKTYGITVMTVKRGNETISNVDAQTVLFLNDVVTVVGEHNNLKKAHELFKPTLAFV